MLSVVCSTALNPNQSNWRVTMQCYLHLQCEPSLPQIKITLDLGEVGLLEGSSPINS